MPDVVISGAGPNGGGTDSFGANDNVRGKIQGLPDSQVMADIKAAAEYVAKLPAANGKIVVGGFCWGGGKTFNYAATGAPFAAGLVFYGTAVKPEQMYAIKAPIYGFYGGNDARIAPQPAPQVQQAPQPAPVIVPQAAPPAARVQNNNSNNNERGGRDAPGSGNDAGGGSDRGAGPKPGQR